MRKMLDIRDYVYSEFDDVRMYGSPPTDYNVCCPFCIDRIHDDDTKFHLNIAISHNVVHCFRCGYKNSWIGMIMDMKGCTYANALGIVYRRPNVRNLSKAFITNDSVPTEVHEASLPKDFIYLSSTHKSEYLPYKEYLYRRGFKYKVWYDYGLGIAEKTVLNRVVIPIEHGYWQGRAIYKWMSPKYYNPKLEARNHIFNSGALEAYDEVVICEGAFSAIAVGFNSIAMIGKEPVKEKVERLLNSEVSTFILALEPKAFGTMGELANILSKNGKHVIIWRYMIGDPATHESPIIMDYSFKNRVKLSLDL
jgi:DNA primase